MAATAYFWALSTLALITKLKPKLTMLKDSTPGCQDTKGVFNSASCLE